MPPAGHLREKERGDKLKTTIMEEGKLFAPPSRELNEKKAALAPENVAAWRTFSRTVFQAGALPEKTKQLIAVAVAHVTQCPYCIRAHTRGALQKGATREEIMEAIWVAAEMRAGAAYAHANIAMDEMESVNR
jgi:AhpD family alkylhydroperoxidase